jgi:hypothetical protein
MRDGVARAERQERKARRRMPVHGRSLEAVVNAIRKRAEDLPQANKTRPGRKPRSPHDAHAPRPLCYKAPR